MIRPKAYHMGSVFHDVEGDIVIYNSNTTRERGFVRHSSDLDI